MSVKLRGPVTDEEKLGDAHWYIDNPGGPNDGKPVMAVAVIGSSTATPVDAANGTPTGAVSIADGDDSTQGAIADVAWDLSGDATVVAALKKTALLLDTIATDTPDTFKTAAATASGDTAVWTPAAGKKFKLRRVLIQVTQNAVQSSGGVITIALRDAAAAIGVTVSVFVPAAAATTFGPGYSSGWLDLGEGVTSALADNVLNVNLSAALTGGTVRVVVAGQEV